MESITTPTKKSRPKTAQMSNSYLVYSHIFPNGKRYIGITSQSAIKRWGGGRGYKKCPKVYKAIEKYGWENIEHLVLYEGLSKEAAESIERKLIVEFDTIRNGYNIDHGGNAAGTHSIETKRKISEGNRGKKKGPATEERKAHLSKINTGSGNPFYGKHHSEEVREKHSSFMNGNQFNKGNHHTEMFKKWKSEQMHQKYKDGGNPKCKEVVMVDPQGIETVFYSLRNAAETVDVCPATIIKRIKNGTELKGCYWRYRHES